VLEVRDYCVGYWVWCSVTSTW